MGDTFTDEELAEATKWDTLGPEYFGARKAATEFMAKFEADQFKPMVDSFVGEFRDKLWSDITDFLLSDTESNLHMAVARMVKGTVEALLTGEEWALRRYPLAAEYDADKIRKAIAEHVGDEVARLRIEALEKEIEDLKQRLEWSRRS